MGKNRANTIATLVLVLSGIAVGCYISVSVPGRDRTPPVITMESDTLEVSASHTREDLMQGVTAWDKRDGDVTGNMVIEQISDINEAHTAKMIYAAFDQAGNVAKTSRMLVFTDYHGPRFGQRKPLVFSQESKPDVLRFLTAEDVVDGDISGYIKGTLISDTADLSRAGEHQVEFRVTNRMGDTAKITLPVDVYEAKDYNAAIELSDYLVYIRQGESFRGEDYLTELKAGRKTYSLKNPPQDVQVVWNAASKTTRTDKHVIHITMEDDVKADVPGVYSVKYYAEMDGYTAYTRLNVVVEGR